MPGGIMVIPLGRVDCLRILLVVEAVKHGRHALHYGFDAHHDHQN